MNPYESLDSNAFWSQAVARKSMFDISGLWQPAIKFGPRSPVVTFGSCFAQHIGRALRAQGFNWVNAEPKPAGLPDDTALAYNYGVFSARTGNIYTAGLLAQWVGWALGDATPPEEVWEKDGRFYDPFRPQIEPDGFASAEEVRASREMAIEAFRKCITDARVFVFTLGLTESWVNAPGGWEYPMCPGTAAGEFDPEAHVFVNQDYVAVRRALAGTIRRMREANPKLLFLLTVSPVPLTATRSGKHVLVATMESKSILRAVAGSLASSLAFVDYFPSYEIINSAPFRGAFFEPNQRSVNPAGVAHVMREFFTCLGVEAPAAGAAERPQPRRAGAAAAAGPRKAGPRPGGRQRKAATGDDLVCEEALLDAFSTKGA